MRADLIIKNGYILDGTGRKAYHGDIGICKDKICFLKKSDFKKSGSEGVSIIDAKNMIITPGFIDVHSHSEFTVLADNRLEGKIFQGITTEINGNCGLSAAPLIGEVIEYRKREVDEFNIRERWQSLREYFEILNKKGLYINFATLVGHGNIRGSIIGYKNKKASKTQLNKMKELLSDAINDGAIGMSTGLIYPPGVFATTGEIIELNKVINNFIYTSHIRSEGDTLLESIEEIIEIGKNSNIQVHVSHIKSSWRRNWWKIDEAIRMINKARKYGLNITCDRYPYIASSTDLDVLLPSNLYSLGVLKEIKRLKNRNVRRMIREELIKKHGNMDFFNDIYISCVSKEKNKWMEGRSIREIADKEKNDPFEVLINILIEEELKVSAIFFSMSEDNLLKILKLPYSVIGTDSSGRSFDGPTCKGKPHPRGFGTFPRFLGKYIRDKGIMDLNDAIYKITYLPAKIFNLKGRGIIKEGAYADIVIFDYKKIKDNADYQKPFTKPSGIYCVIVNGEPVLYDGELTGKKPGKILNSKLL